LRYFSNVLYESNFVSKRCCWCYHSPAISHCIVCRVITVPWTVRRCICHTSGYFVSRFYKIYCHMLRSRLCPNSKELLVSKFPKGTDAFITLLNCIVKLPKCCAMRCNFNYIVYQNVYGHNAYLNTTAMPSEALTSTAGLYVSYPDQHVRKRYNRRHYVQ